MESIYGYKKENVIDMIRNNTAEDLKNLLKSVVIESKNEINLQNLYTFFSDIFDEIYHDLVFKKVIQSKNLRQALELLSTPIYQKSKEDQKKLLKEIFSLVN